MWERHQGDWGHTDRSHLSFMLFMMNQVSIWCETLGGLQIFVMLDSENAAPIIIAAHSAILGSSASNDF